MLNFIRFCRLLQNFRTPQKLQLASVAYQFRQEAHVYYPDRQSEMHRFNEQQKNQIISEAQVRKNLPKDFYYKILGVRKHATMQQIKAAYYGLAKRFHPDASNTPMERKRFQEISNAYHILTDETKRLEYDQLGAVKDEQDFLKSISNSINVKMTTKSESNIPVSREDLVRMTNGELKLDLNFLEAAHGVKKSIDIRLLKKCPACNGKSPKQINRSESEMCRKCNGTGQITKKTKTYTSLLICDQCEGKRFINRNNCETCDNRGIVLETLKVIVNIPAGVKTGDVFPVEHPKTKQRATYRVQVAESDYYKRSGNDVHTVRYITIAEAILGGTFKVRGLHDDVDIKLEPGVESHSQVVLKGKGIKSREGLGNHIVTFKVRIPRTITTKQRQLILAYAKTEDPSFVKPPY